MSILYWSLQGNGKLQKSYDIHWMPLNIAGLRLELYTTD